MAKADWRRGAWGVRWGLARYCIFKLASGRKQPVPLSRVLGGHTVVGVEAAKLCQALQCQDQESGCRHDKVKSGTREFGTFAWRCEMAAVLRVMDRLSAWHAWQLKIFPEFNDIR
jgi:hypothetical protein